MCFYYAKYASIGQGVRECDLAVLVPARLILGQPGTDVVHLDLLRRDRPPIANAGYLRVSVTPSNVTVEYVRTSPSSSAGTAASYTM
jgi:hypothetical protein